MFIVPAQTSFPAADGLAVILTASVRDGQRTVLGFTSVQRLENYAGQMVRHLAVRSDQLNGLLEISDQLRVDPGHAESYDIHMLDALLLVGQLDSALAQATIRRWTFSEKSIRSIITAPADVAIVGCEIVCRGKLAGYLLSVQTRHDRSDIVVHQDRLSQQRRDFQKPIVLVLPRPGFAEYSWLQNRVAALI